MKKPIKIGTRGSPLALAQSHEVKNKLLGANPALTEEDIEIVIIKVMGDQITDRSLMAAGGKGLFTKEIEEALLDGQIDMAVHSTKDMPTTLPKGLILNTFLKREDPRDAFISPQFSSIDDLPKGAVVGTASLRRRAQLLRLRNDLKVVNFRGNVQTRLKKLETTDISATFLAVAGLNRLDLAKVISAALSVDDFLPAPAQGAIAIEVRDTDDTTKDQLEALHDQDTAIAVSAERALLKALDGSCKTPIAALATINAGIITLTAELLSVNGVVHFRESAEAPTTEAERLGKALGESLRELAGETFFEKLADDVEALL